MRSRDRSLSSIGISSKIGSGIGDDDLGRPSERAELLKAKN